MKNNLLFLDLSVWCFLVSVDRHLRSPPALIKARDILRYDKSLRTLTRTKLSAIANQFSIDRK
jgi:hypothetical protein